MSKEDRFQHRLNSLEEALVEESKYSIEKILEILVSEETSKAYTFMPEKPQAKDTLDNAEILVDEKDQKANLLLYELEKGLYYVYRRKEDRPKVDELYKQKEEFYNKPGSENNYGLFIPTGVTVRSVPQSVLGNGVLGRAFIYSNYIEILDSLVGNEYTEVLTHEVLHIIYPEKKEMEIRQMTRNYLGNATVYH